ncbi:MAG: hypothetical protein QOD77_1907 [Thermoplasmata archaeon]|jgi:uncharacterized membrane protein|nr:hypothetical protein [Thermoplasmata archaeon]
MPAARFSRILAPALAFVMVATLLATPASAVAPFTNSVVDAQLVTDYGAGGPFGSWQKQYEWTTLYLHSSCAENVVGPEPTEDYSDCIPAGAATHLLDTQYPTKTYGNVMLLEPVDTTSGLGPTLTAGNYADFPNAAPCVNDYLVTADTLISGFDSTIWMSGDRINSNRLRVVATLLDGSSGACSPTGSNLATFDLTSSTPAPQSWSPIDPTTGVFSGAIDIPSAHGTEHGLLVKAGSRLRFSIGLVTDDTWTLGDGGANVLLDGVDVASRVRVHSDSARINMWTADRFGAVEDAFPNSAIAPIADRKVFFNAVQFDPFGHTQACPSVPAAANGCPRDAIEEHDMRLRIKDVTPTHTAINGFCSSGFLCYDRYVKLDLGQGLQDNDGGNRDSFLGCCDEPAIRPIKAPATTADNKEGIQRYAYTFVYGQTFPDGLYQIEFQDRTEKWVFTRTFEIGNTGFTFQFHPKEQTVNADGSIADHTVALGELTKYSMTIRNDGPRADTFGLAVPVPGLGWSASFSPSSITLNPKQEGSVEVTVAPAPAARPGDIKVVAVTATSLADSTVKTLYTRTTLTAQEEFGIELSSPMDGIQTRPQVPTNFPLDIRNAGTVLDQYVLTASNAPPGWVVQINPSFLPVKAASRETLSVRVTAPAEAAAGSSFTLLLKACRTVDMSVCGELSMPVNVYHVDDVRVSALKDHIVLRDAALDRSAGATKDRLFDQGPLFRVLVENKGDREDTIEITGGWTPGQGANDRTNCEGSPTNSGDGVPDGWRFNLLDSASGVEDPGLVLPAPAGGRLTKFTAGSPTYTFHPSPAAPQKGGAGASTNYAGDFRLGHLTLAPGASQYVFIDMYWVQPTGAGCLAQIATNYRTRMPAPVAEFRLTYRSLREEAVKGALVLTGEIDGSTRDDIVAEDARVPGTPHGVLLEYALGQSDIGFAPINSGSPWATYNLVLTNTGREVDHLKLRVDDGKNGWRHQILAQSAALATGVVGSLSTTDPGGRVARSNPCLPTDAPASQNFRCNSIGVYDTVYIQVRAIPPAGRVIVGDSDDMTISLTSDFSSTGTIIDTKTVRTYVQGTYGLDVESFNTNLVGYPGQVVKFPYTLRNVGQENDRYFLQGKADTGAEGWTTSLSSGSVVAVPGGREFHGFLAVTVPTNAPITDPAILADLDPDAAPPAPAHFRIEAISMDNPAKQSRVLDFFLPVTTYKGLTVVAPDVEIAPGTSDRIQVTTRATEGAPAPGVTYDGYYSSHPDQEPPLPRGFSFTCLQGPGLPGDNGHPHFDDKRGCDPNAPYWLEVFFNSGDEAIQQLEVNVPSNQLGISRIAHRIAVVADVSGSEDIVTYVDAVINMGSLYGVALVEDEDKATRIIPPGNLGAAGPTVVYNVRVENKGLSPQSVLLTNSDLPAGWQIFYETRNLDVQPPGHSLVGGPESCESTVDPCKNVDPLDYEIVQIGLSAPADAVPGDVATVLIFGTVQQNTDQVAQLELRAIVGKYAMTVTGVPQTAYVAPQEQARFAVEVRNTGNVDTGVLVTAVLPPTVANDFPVSWSDDLCGEPYTAERGGGKLADGSCKVDLAPDETRTVQLEVLTPEAAPTKAGPGYDVTLSAKAAEFSSAVASGALKVKILDYQMADVDGDLQKEFAVDGCTVAQTEGCLPDAADGYETFRENLLAVGVTTRRAPLEQYLSADGRAAHTKDGALDLRPDADGDDKTDLVLDDNNDGLPDILWIPATNRVQRLNFTRDVDADGLAEYFADLEGDQQWDAVYNLARGEFVGLIQTYADKDGFLDYIVDADGDGEIDQYETILFGGPNGKLGNIQYNALIDGDDLLDKAFDTDGDGQPEYFLPYAAPGETPKSVPIVLEDVTGDGKLDWTYDHLGKGGKPTSYYDPVTGERGLIDSKGEFLGDLQKYWYIALLFGLALVLFVALVVVTRRK